MLSDSVNFEHSLDSNGQEGKEIEWWCMSL